MFNWLKKNVVNPVVGFFKSLFGYKQLEDKAAKAEKELAQANKTIAELNRLYDNLTEGNNVLIRKYNNERVDYLETRAQNEKLKRVVVILAKQKEDFIKTFHISEEDCFKNEVRTLKYLDAKENEINAITAETTTLGLAFSRPRP